MVVTINNSSFCRNTNFRVGGVLFFDIYNTNGTGLIVDSTPSQLDLHPLLYEYVKAGSET